MSTQWRRRHYRGSDPPSCPPLRRGVTGGRVTGSALECGALDRSCRDTRQLQMELPGRGRGIGRGSAVIWWSAAAGAGDKHVVRGGRTLVTTVGGRSAPRHLSKQRPGGPPFSPLNCGRLTRDRAAESATCLLTSRAQCRPAEPPFSAGRAAGSRARPPAVCL